MALSSGVAFDLMSVEKFDVVLWGCTGFTGQLVAEYFATDVAKKHPSVRWALAGRNLSKLEALRKRVMQLAHEKGDVGRNTHKPAILVADSTDKEAVDAVVAQAKVVCATAGPFDRYGTPVVDACVRLGAHYVDITGETTWVHRMKCKYGEAAKKNGVYIVSMCGFDSLPSDIGTWYTVQLMKKVGNYPVRRVTNLMAMNGKLSGGTLATGLHSESQGPEVIRQLADPFLLGGRRPEREEDKDCTQATFHEDLSVWGAPFMMANIN